MENFTRSPKTVVVGKSAGDRLFPAFPQVFHRHLLAITQAQ
ncbi:MAG: hypothetical protein ABI180_11490 [Microcoleus sp.]